jgi:hypothetical protein
MRNYSPIKTRSGPLDSRIDAAYDRDLSRNAPDLRLHFFFIGSWE